MKIFLILYIIKHGVIYSLSSEIIQQLMTQINVLVRDFPVLGAGRASISRFLPTGRRSPQSYPSIVISLCTISLYLF